jgi:hypothetical protein
MQQAMTHLPPHVILSAAKDLRPEILRSLRVKTLFMPEIAQGLCLHRVRNIQKMQKTDTLVLVFSG